MFRKILFFLFLAAIAAGGWFSFGNLSSDYLLKITPDDFLELAGIAAVTRPLPPVAVPDEIKAVYVTAPAAASPNYANYLIKLIESTELNSAVINVKDGNNVYLEQWLADLVRRLREKNIYPIARVVVFQDNQLAQSRPELALKNPDGSFFGKTGYRWLDPASREIWDYNADIAIGALALGFMEINFDYFRFPDGRVNDIVYPVYEYGRPKKDIINDAAAYINKKIKTARPKAVISLDIFADAFLWSADIGVGQKLTELARHFDVIAPMVYPSHYRSGNFSFKNPADHPYEVVRQTLLAGKRQLEKAGVDVVVRPWIQDFNMGAVYDRQKIREQIKAISDTLDVCSSLVIASPRASGGEAISPPASHPASHPELVSGSITPPTIVCEQGWMAWNPNVIYSREKYAE